MEQPVARRAHNPKVVGSNPAPATNTSKTINTLKGVFLYLSFVNLPGVYPAKDLPAPRQRRPVREIRTNPCQNRLRHFLLEFCRLELTLLFHVTDKRGFNQMDGISGALSTANPACSTLFLCSLLMLPSLPSTALPNFRLSLMVSDCTMSNMVWST